ncbi:VWA domain-containing protein [Pelagicoccus sp. NFK12]|uniref:VWA domain-containing protein n=1 Tax=Pelagicoccus enzymogenes TaxID=2773457 RepID=A0A927F739_9BACT|nr:VWA domain-containing protein [Pelagicoccus enzymogenes]MBD5779687.1 VWA domain-containing protein [Pelagicoccus enzymogenes]MDQ8199317.1 VWA domain-containing protein [Pelagicoccus enzymogenes]
MSIDWAHEEYLWGLAFPILLLAWNLFHRSRASARRKGAQAQWATAGFGGIKQASRTRARPPKIMLCASLALLVVSVAQPRWGTEEQLTFERSREVIIAIDLSKSMLANDIKPNRLERAKLVVEGMLDTLEGESVGLIVFAGTAFLQSPMSPDYQILRGFLDDINPSFIPQGGTNYTAMMETALDSFEQSDGMADRFLIIISDGESLDSGWESRAQMLKEQNVRTICLGFGTKEGSLIPDGSGGYLKDPQGAVVLSKLEPGTLTQIARITGGIYREASVWVDLAQVVEETVEKGKAALKEREREDAMIERFHYFLAPGLLLLLLSIYWEFPTLPKARTIKRKEATA